MRSPPDRLLTRTAQQGVFFFATAITHSPFHGSTRSILAHSHTIFEQLRRNFVDLPRPAQSNVVITPH